MSHLRVEGFRLRIGSRTLVEALAMQLHPGSCCALLGRNGAGKSTLLAALAGLRPVDAGHIHLNDLPLRRYARADVAREIAVLMQEDHESYWGSTLHYVMLGGLPRRQAGVPAADIEAAALRALVDMDLEAHRDQAYRSLSGGERQRARLAQVLVQDAPVVLLDEPLTHLDWGHQAQAMRRIDAMRRDGRAVLMATHEPQWALRYCDMALLLYDSGRFVHGPAADVLTPANLEALYGCPLAAVAYQDRTLLIPAA